MSMIGAAEHAIGIASVLLIEDNRLIGDALERLASLSNAAIRFDRAATLAGGIATLRSETYDAVLLDLDLPDSRGITTFHRIAAHARDADVLIFSADIDDEAARQAAASGAAGLVMKGEVSIEDLAAQILARKSLA